MNPIRKTSTITFIISSIFLGWGLVQVQQDEDKPSPVIPVDTLPQIDLNAELPLGLSNPPPVPEESPLSDEVVALGRKLFFDPILSEDGTVSCASCHQPDHGFASPDAKAVGLGGRIGKRNAPSLFNKAYAEHMFWDGRAQTLEEQALSPLSNPDELGSDVEVILKKLRGNEEYVGLFKEVFQAEEVPEAVSKINIGKAIASFERTLVIGNTRVDRFHAAEYEALNESARQGMWIFESRGRCWKCHNGETFSDQKFHNTGVSFGTADRDTGRFEHTENEEDQFKFKTPSLRGVAQTPPYMHDGSVKTLREVVEFYNKGGSREDPTLSKDIEPLNLSDEDVENLVAFLKALSD
jgi:cytochrome c peroxidase